MNNMEERYQRNILIEGIGEAGQAKLKAAKALVIGTGGLGSPTLFYLAAAGVGEIGVVDDDVVAVSNLQRQILHFTNDIGQMKTNSAQQKLAALNPEVKIVTYNDRFSTENATQIVNNYDIVIDCCDNFATKFLINDVCVASRKPFVHGAVVAMQGEVMTYVPGAACYRCLFETTLEDGMFPTASQVGILGSVAGLTGSIQATEAIKYLTGMNGLITNRILFIDAGMMIFNFFSVKRRRACICK